MSIVKSLHAVKTSKETHSQTWVSWILRVFNLWVNGGVNAHANIGGIALVIHAWIWCSLVQLLCSLTRSEGGIKMSEKMAKRNNSSSVSHFLHFYFYTFFVENNSIHFNNDMSSLLKKTLVAPLLAIWTRSVLERDWMIGLGGKLLLFLKTSIRWNILEI